MARAKKQTVKTNVETYTIVLPIVSCSDYEQVELLMNYCGIARAISYNKYGSLLGWGIDWKSVMNLSLNSEFVSILDREVPQLDKTRKVREWAVNDTIKNIIASQEAAKVIIKSLIWKKYPMQLNQSKRIAWIEQNKKLVSSTIKSLNIPSGEEGAYERALANKLFYGTLREIAYIHYPKCDIEKERDRLLWLLDVDPTGDNWLHRQYRKHYIPGHTYKRNQIVYQGQGYTCTRINRHSVKLEVYGLNAKERIVLICRSRQIIRGQIRLIRNEQNQLEIHSTRQRLYNSTATEPTETIGVDKGYTEGFYTSSGEKIADGIGKLMTAKTIRITQTNKNRYRIRCYALSLENTEISKHILQNNLGYKVKSKKLKQEKATIQNFIRRDLRRVIKQPLIIFAEDLTSPIKSKKNSRISNRKLNQWMKGELQVSLEQIAKETGSIVKVVNPAYSSQTDSLTRTLLGLRKGDRFIRFTRDEIQADYNASKEIEFRGSDGDLSVGMKTQEVLEVLLGRTIRYLHSMGKTVQEALDLGWLLPKFRATALRLERENYHLQG